jgi:hypothetical protein
VYRGAAPTAAATSMWHWQQQQQQQQQQQLDVHGLPLGHPGHQSELGDMLHMLGHHQHGHHAAHHAGTVHHGFENLGGMFTGQYQ